jgi:DNA-binding transcriptional LysR family regulator
MARAPMEWERRIGRRLRLRDLHILSTVVQWGSMAKAAEHLAVSQPAVSDAIANLETALAVRLLDRSPRGVEPTIYAEALLKRGDVVFDELRQGIRDIEFLTNPAAGEVRIGCPESHAFVSSAIIDRLSRRYPDVVVHVVTAQPATLECDEKSNEIPAVQALLRQLGLEARPRRQRDHGNEICAIERRNEARGT